MKINIIREPNKLIETSILLGKYLEGTLEIGDLVKEEARFSLKKGEINQSYQAYIGAINLMKNELDRLVIPYGDLMAKLAFKDMDNSYGFILDSINHNGVDNIEDLSYDQFRIGLLQKLYSLPELEDILEEDQWRDDYLGRQNLDLGDIFRLLEENQVERDTSLGILSIFNNLEEIYRDYRALMEELVKLYDSYYQELEGFFLARLQEVEERQWDDEARLYFRRYIDIGDWENRSINYYLSVIAYNGLSVFIPKNKDLAIKIVEGVLVEDLLGLLRENRDLGSIGNKIGALGDTRRFEIVGLLLEKSYYLKELSDQLELSSPTVSHHMGILLEAGLVKIRSQGRKIYYDINREGFREMGQVLERIGEMSHEDQPGI